jgi:hypothetical protein
MEPDADDINTRKLRNGLAVNVDPTGDDDGLPAFYPPDRERKGDRKRKRSSTPCSRRRGPTSTAAADPPRKRRKAAHALPLLDPHEWILQRCGVAVPAEITTQIFETVVRSARGDASRDGEMSSALHGMRHVKQKHKRAMRVRLIARATVAELLRIGFVCRAWREAVFGRGTPLVSLWRETLGDIRGVGREALRRCGASTAIDATMRYMSCVQLCGWAPSRDYIVGRVSRAISLGRLGPRMFARFGIDFDAFVAIARLREEETRIEYAIKLRQREAHRIYAARVRRYRERVSAGFDLMHPFVPQMPEAPSGSLTEAEIGAIQAVREKLPEMRKRLRRKLVA